MIDVLPHARERGSETVSVRFRHSITPLILALASVTAAHAAVVRVPEDALTIQHAIDVAEAGDTIEVGPGTWREAIDLRGKSVLLLGKDGATKTIIDGTGKGDSVVRCVTNEGPGTVIQGLTLTGGTGHAGLHGKNLSLGGGMLALGASPTLRDCIIVNNSATGNGGGVYCGTGADVRFEKCVFKGNSAEKGGGVLCVGSKPVFDRCLFEKNTARYSGGGLYAARGSDPTVRSSRFEMNRAAYNGGGICTLDAAGEVLDTVFERNRAVTSGGAIYSGWRATLSASACRFNDPGDTVVGGTSLTRRDLRRGACDLGDQICVVAEERDCLAAAGIYKGDGSQCAAPDPVLQARRRGDLDGDGKVDRRDLSIMMLLWR